MRACISTVLSLIQVSFEGDIPILEYEPNLDDILNDVGEMSSCIQSCKCACIYMNVPEQLALH